MVGQLTPIEMATARLLKGPTIVGLLSSRFLSGQVRIVVTVFQIAGIVGFVNYIS